MKIIFAVTGNYQNSQRGAMSASIGSILQSYGYTVTFLKINPFLNYDTGRLSPSELGETFVLKDGSEVDIDLFLYQKYCSLVLSKENFLTAGNLLYDVIAMEKDGNFNGKLLGIHNQYKQYIIERIKLLEQTKVTTIKDGVETYNLPDVLICELGGSIFKRDAALFLNSFSDIISSYKQDETFTFLYDFNLEDKNNQNTLFNSLSQLSICGVTPNAVVYKTSADFDIESFSKITGIQASNVFLVNDIGSIYDLPQIFDSVGLYDSIKYKLSLNKKIKIFNLSEKFINLTKNFNRVRKIGILTRYCREDYPYYSVEESLVTAGRHLGCNIDILYINYTKLAENNTDEYKKLKEVDGILIPGGFGNSHVDTKVMVANYCRTNKIPCLGICLGFQIMLIEFARNVLGYNLATSEEFEPESTETVVKKFPEIVCKNTGKNIFLGDYEVNFTGSMSKIYKQSRFNEIFRHRYTLNYKYLEEMQKNGLIIEGVTDDNRAVALNIPENHFYKGAQYHPELSATLDSVDPIFTAFIESTI